MKTKSPDLRLTPQEIYVYPALVDWLALRAKQVMTLTADASRPALWVAFFPLARVQDAFDAGLTTAVQQLNYRRKDGWVLATGNPYGVTGDYHRTGKVWVSHDLLYHEFIINQNTNEDEKQ